MKTNRLKEMDAPLVVLLLLAAFFLVVKALRLGYFSQWMDEGFYYLAAQKIKTLGYPLYPSGHVLYKSIFFSFLLAGFSTLSGFTTASLRLFSVIVHVSTPVILYLSLKNLLKKEVRFATGILLYFSLWQTEYSRLILYNILAELLIFWGMIWFFKKKMLGENKLYALIWIPALLTHQLAMALVFCFVALLILKTNSFFSRRNILALLLWAPVFVFVQIQETVLWKVGQVYSTQRIFSLTDMFTYFFHGFSLTYYKILRKSFPFYSALFLLGSVVFIVLLIIKKNKKENLSLSQKLAAFILIHFSCTVVFLGFIRTHAMPRYLFPFIIEMFLLNSYYLYESSFFLLRMFVRNRRASLAALAVTLIIPFGFVNDIGWGNVRSVITREYVDEIRSDIITTSGRSSQEDHGSVGEYVRRNRQETDMVIAMHMVFQYLYAGRVDGWLFSGGPGTWDAGVLVNGQWREFYLGVPWIKTAAELKEWIDRSLAEKKRVWVITSPSAERLDHIDDSIRRFLRNSKDRVKWVAKDGMSKAYLFDLSDSSRRFYEAEWGIPGKGELLDRNNLSPDSKVIVREKYRTSYLPLKAGRYALRFHFDGSDGRQVLVRLKEKEKTRAQMAAIIQGSSISFKFKVRENGWYFFELLPLKETVVFDFIEEEIPSPE